MRACAVFWFWFLQSHLSSCVQASKHTAEEASASSAFFDELVPQNMTPWEIPTTEGTLVWEAGGPRVFGFRSPLLSPASHLKPQLQVALISTRTFSSQSLDGCCLWMAFCCGLFPAPSFLVKMTAAFPMLSKHTHCAWDPAHEALSVLNPILESYSWTSTPWDTVLLPEMKRVSFVEPGRLN